MSEPLKVLGLGPLATPDEVKARWRELAGLHHPDRGGDAAEFHRYRLAYHQALKTASICKNCHGKGKTIVANGLSQLMIRCPSCKGTGSLE